MKFGLGQLTLQRPPWDPRDHARLYADALELARIADRAGFDSFWLAEHHGSEDGYIPSPLAFLSAVAASTDNLAVGTGVLLAPLHHPIRLAEDAAVVDAISGGRLNLGLGLGWVPDEYAMFGVPMKGRGRRLEEIVEILRRAWTGERFSFHGRFYSFDDVAVRPAPARPIPIWLGGASPAALERAARLADGHFPSSTGALASHLERAREMLALRARLGVEGPYRFGMFVPVGIGSDPDEGWARIRDGLLHVRGSYAIWGQGRRDVENARDLAAGWEGDIRAGAICGSPEQIVEILRGPLRELDALGFDEVFCSAILVHPGMRLEDAAEAVETFASEVVPALRGSPANPA